MQMSKEYAESRRETQRDADQPRTTMENYENYENCENCEKLWEL